MNEVKKKSPLTASFRWAWQGIITCVRRERNMKIHICTAALVILAGFLFQISTAEWFICLILFGLVMGLELVNTAIEAVVDLVCPEEHPKAKLAKDAAAGAVLVCAFFAAIVGLIIFLPKLLSLFS